MTIGPRIYIYTFYTQTVRILQITPTLPFSPHLSISRCFSAWQPASLKSECLLARPSRYFSCSPSLPIIHLSFSIFVALFLLVVLPLSSSMHFFSFSSSSSYSYSFSLSFSVFFLWSIRRPSCSCYVFLIPINAKQRPRRTRLQCAAAILHT